jgi:hypothetical protein
MREKGRKKGRRLPLPRKPSHPHGPPKGKKGYDRKRERGEIDKEAEE